jgi:hypothetical protein
MENDNLVNVVTQLYHAVSGQKPATEMTDRIKSGVEAALKIKDADVDLFYGLVAVGLVEVKEKLGLSKEGCDYADKLVRHYCGKSSYMRTPGK